MKTNGHDPRAEATRRLLGVVQAITQQVFLGIQAACHANETYGSLDISLAVIRGLIDGSIACVPVDAKLPDNERMFVRALAAAKKAIAEEIGRRIEVVPSLSVVKQ